MKLYIVHFLMDIASARAFSHLMLSLGVQAGRGRRSSFLWRSLLHGKKALQVGLRKRIGNGEDTYIWIDKWIPLLPLGRDSIDPAFCRTAKKIRSLPENDYVVSIIDIAGAEEDITTLQLLNER